MNLEQIVADLKKERDRMAAAISALEGGTSPVATRKTPAPGRRKRRHRLTAAGRKRLSDAMKKRWAQRRKKMSKP